MVTAPPPLRRLRDFNAIDSAQKDYVPSLQEVAETFVCAPKKCQERQWPLPTDWQRPQTFLLGQSGIRRCCLSASSSDAIYGGSKASYVCSTSSQSRASRNASLWLAGSLHPAPNSTGHLMDARFSVGSNFNVITRPKDAAEDIYLFFGCSRADARLLSYMTH